MDNAAIISGFSSYLSFAEDSTQLIERLKQGARVDRKPWFASDEEAIKCGFNGNKYVGRLEHLEESALEQVYSLIEKALDQAMLSTQCLAGDNVRVYLTGIGPRVDAIHFNSLYNKSDVEDIVFVKSLAKLNAANMSQDILSGNIARKYHLRYLPPNMNCTSNSSLTAVHLGCHAIEHGGVDLVLVINCSRIKTQDIWFLETQSMLDSHLVQPFGENSKGVLFSEGLSTLLLESASHRQARGISGGVRLQTEYTQISARRSNDSTWLSTSMFKVMQKTMKKADVQPEDLCAIIPHANGSSLSDKAEANAIGMFTDGQTIPVLAWKGQIGYTTTGSGIVDLIIGHHALTHNELISAVSNDTIIDAMAPCLLVDSGVIKHNKKHLLKTGVGVDGSIIGAILTQLDK